MPIAIACSMCRHRRAGCDVTSSCEYYAPVLCFPEDYVLEAAAGCWLDDWAAKNPSEHSWGRDTDAEFFAVFRDRLSGFERKFYADTRAGLMKEVRDKEFLHNVDSDE